MYLFLDKFDYKRSLTEDGKNFSVDDSLELLGSDFKIRVHILTRTFADFEYEDEVNVYGSELVADGTVQPRPDGARWCLPLTRDPERGYYEVVLPVEKITRDTVLQAVLLVNEDDASKTEYVWGGVRDFSDEKDKGTEVPEEKEEILEPPKDHPGQLELF